MSGRRGRKEGSIYKRKSDGRWCGVIDCGYSSDGRRMRKVFYGASRAEVAAKLNKAVHDLSIGLPVITVRHSLSEYLDAWLADIRHSVRPLTYQQYEGHCRLYLKPTLGMCRLDKLTPHMVRQFVDKMLSRGLSPRTVQLSLVILRHALSQAVKDGMIVRNVAKLVQSPRVVRHQFKVFSREEARRFLAAIRGHRLEALYIVALTLGLRQGEVLGLSWDAIDFDAGTLTITQSLERIGGKRYGSPGRLVLVEPKTAGSRRTLKLPDIALKALSSHRARQLQERFQCGRKWQDTGLVFTTRHGTPIEPSDLHGGFKRILADAKLPTMRFHDLRHSAATILVASGVPLKVIQTLLGHSTITLTANTYAHVLPELLDDCARRMDAAFGDADGLGASA